MFLKKTASVGDDPHQKLAALNVLLTDSSSTNADYIRLLRTEVDPAEQRAAGDWEGLDANEILSERFPAHMRSGNTAYHLSYAIPQIREGGQGDATSSESKAFWASEVHFHQIEHAFA